MVPSLTLQCLWWYGSPVQPKNPVLINAKVLLEQSAEVYRTFLLHGRCRLPAFRGRGWLAKRIAFRDLCGVGLD